MYKDCQTEAGSEDCSQSKMGSNIEFIIAQTVVQCNNKGGLCIARGGPDMAAINSLGGPHVLPQTVWGDHF